jgi:hypothetical protein
MKEKQGLSLIWIRPSHGLVWVQGNSPLFFPFSSPSFLFFSSIFSLSRSHAQQGATPSLSRFPLSSSLSLLSFSSSLSPSLVRSVLGRAENSFSFLSSLFPHDLPLPLAFSLALSGFTHGREQHAPCPLYNGGKGPLLSRMVCSQTLSLPRLDPHACFSFLSLLFSLTRWFHTARTALSLAHYFSSCFSFSSSRPCLSLSHVCCLLVFHLLLCFSSSLFPSLSLYLTRFCC